MEEWQKYFQDNINPIMWTIYKVLRDYKFVEKEELEQQARIFIWKKIEELKQFDIAYLITSLKRELFEYIRSVYRYNHTSTDEDTDEDRDKVKKKRLEYEMSDKKDPEKYTIVIDRLRFVKSQFKENDFRIYIDRFINEMTIGQLSKKYNLPKSKIKLICLNGKKVVMNIKELER